MATIQQQFETLERQKSQLLANLSTQSPDNLRRSPQAGQWSALEIVDHLIKVEAAILRGMQEQLPAGHPVGLQDQVGGWIVTFTMLLPVRIRTPAGASATLPSTDLDFPGLCELWDLVRTELHLLIQSLTPAQLPLGLTLHPIGGWMPISRTLKFISAHLHHHCYQLKRLGFACR